MRRGLTIEGTANVDYTSTVNNGKVQIYVFPVPGQTGASIVSAGVINQCMPGTQVSADSSNGCNGYPIGDSTAFQVYVGESGRLDITGAQAGAVLYAPAMTTAIHAGSCSWVGSLVLNSLTVDGNPNFNFAYDIRDAPWSRPTGR